MFSTDQIAMLDAKLDGSRVKTRVQAGRTLSYLEGWWFIAEANRIFGFDGWDRRTQTMVSVHEPYQNERQNWVVSYRAEVCITVSCGDGKVAREGAGFGSGIDRDLGRAHESALKEAETDAMKRALMTFGNPFGLALYDKSQADVERGNGHGAPTAAARPIPSPAHAGKVQDDPPWRLLADDIKAAIDAAPTLKSLNDEMARRGQDFSSANAKGGSDLEFIYKYSGQAYAFLTDRANKRRHILASTPQTGGGDGTGRSAQPYQPPQHHQSKDPDPRPDPFNLDDEIPF